VNVGAGNLTLSSGKDGSGNWSDFSWGTSGITLQGASIGALDLSGYRDITFDTPLVSTSTITAQAERDLALGIAGTLTSTNNTTLVAGRNFNNLAGANGLTSISGRWLVYSTAPASDIIGDLPYTFRKFGCTYGGSCSSLGSGNGLVYSVIDPDSPEALIDRIPVPDSVISLAQTPQQPSAALIGDTSYASNLPAKIVLIFEEELAKQLDLEDWYF
jgi:hypothetical protein